MEPKPIHILYKNNRDEVKWRKILPIRLYWGSTEYHPDPQWILEAMDVDKGAERSFAFADAFLIGEDQMKRST